MYENFRCTTSIVLDNTGTSNKITFSMYSNRNLGLHVQIRPNSESISEDWKKNLYIVYVIKDNLELTF